MTSTLFKGQVAQLTTELRHCYTLCSAIRTTRKIGNTHHNLDRLQESLQSSAAVLPVEYNNTRSLIGQRFDAGDTIATAEMARHVLDVRDVIKHKLNEIAHPTRQRDRGEREVPGFGELLRRWNDVHASVTQTMESLARRLADTKPAAPQTPKPTPRPSQPDEVTLQVKELEILLDHIKNSWEERIVAGRVEYVNMFDAGKKVSERPVNAFVKPLARPARPVRMGSYERTSKMAGRNPSRDANGW